MKRKIFIPSFIFARSCKKQSRVFQLHDVLKGQFETAGKSFVRAAETASG